MRLLFVFLFFLFLSCSKEDSLVAVDDNTSVDKIIPSGTIYLDQGDTDTVYVVLTSTKPLSETVLSYTLSGTYNDSASTPIEEVLLNQWITVSMPNLATLFPGGVYTDTVAIPVAVALDARQTIGLAPYNLKFTHTYGEKIHSRSLSIYVAPHIAITAITPALDTLDTLLLPDVDSFAITVESNDLIIADSLSISFKKPNGYPASAFLSAQILPFVPAESVTCTAVVSLLSSVDVQGDYKMIVEAKNQKAEDKDSVRIYIEGPDSITIDSLIIEADSVSPGGKLEGLFRYKANKLMSRNDVSFSFTDLALNPVTTISGHAHTFESFFRGSCDFDINVGDNTPVGSYLYHVIMTNDSLSDTLSGTIHVAVGIVEQLRIESIIPNPLTMYKEFGQMKATFLIRSTKRITTANSYYDLVDTSDSSVLSGLLSHSVDMKEENGIYKSTVRMKPKDTLSEGRYSLRYGCALDSVGDTVSVAVTVAPFSIDIEDIPNQTIAKGATVQLTAIFNSTVEFDLSEFQSEVIAADNSHPQIRFLSYAQGVLTFTVTIPPEALVSDADVKVGIGGYMEYFKVSIVEP